LFSSRHNTKNYLSFLILLPFCVWGDVVIENNRKKSDSSLDFGASEELQSIFDSIREEIDDHLCSINENTNELQSNYEYISQVDAKLDKLSERLDQMQMFLQRYGFSVEEKPKFNCQPLTKKEQEVFLLLYTLEEKGAVSYDDIARRSGIPSDSVAIYITCMIQKGVPIIKRCIHNKMYMKLDKDFKKAQAKENVLKISQTIIPNIVKNR